MAKLPVIQAAHWCANCSYWCGEREINGFFRRVEIDDNCKATGKCSNMKGYYNQPCIWNGTCPHFSKHPAVK